MRSRTLAAAVALGVVALAVPPVTASAATSSASPLTVSGKGAFSALEVTVSQTKNLINQVVEVSWKGGEPTQPPSGSFAVNYLQIFQCWGDSPDGPEREQCQFGGFAGDGRAGQNVASRQTNQSVIDPAETYVPVAGSGVNSFVPFRSVTGKVATGAVNEFFDQNTTNEIPLARTRADGRGLEYFEVQTAREAAGLGCGEPLTTSPSTKGRKCWLVVVPRNDREVDGSVRTTSAINQLVSSGLSATNWAQRLVVPLEFEPLGLTCPLGAVERRTVGNEPVVEAISRWQPTLCQGSDRVFGFSQVPEATGRRVLTGDDPGLVFVGRGLDPAELPGRVPAYAPVTLSGMGIAFNIDSAAARNAPPEVQLRDAQRIGELKLTPRLVAKLITQSYRLGVSFAAPSVKDNPLDMTRDPEFTALNPAFTQLSYPSIADALLPTGLTDDARQVWLWLASDAEAKAFLTGTPDPWGMKVNPNYKGLELPQDGFPKSDPFCREFTSDQPPLCTLDAHPYAADLHDAARSASRGDTLVRTSFDPLAVPPGYRKSSPQPIGGRYVLALTDTASAARFGIPMAKLRNKAGAFVAPTSTSLLAAVAGVGVGASTAAPQVDPATPERGAYPLALLTHAATVPVALSAGARRDYAAFLRYAVGAGQMPGNAPGELPDGYAPLPTRLRTKTLALAAALESPPRVVTTPPTKEPTGGAPGGAPVVTDGGGGDVPIGTGVVVPSTVGVAPAPLPTTAGPTPTATTRPAPVAPAAAPVRLDARSALPVGAAQQYALMGVVLLGALAALAGPVLTRLTSRQAR